jgi:phosphocarrier protein
MSVSRLFRRKEKRASRVFTIKNRYGIHARPAALFVKAVSVFDSEVWVLKDGNKVSGKSIMGLLSIEASRNAQIKVTAMGPDADEALGAIESLIDGNFDED